MKFISSSGVGSVGTDVLNTVVCCFVNKNNLFNKTVDIFFKKKRSHWLEKC